MPSMNLDSPLYPSAGELHFSVDSKGDGDVLASAEVEIGPRVDMLHSMVQLVAARSAWSRVGLYPTPSGSLSLMAFLVITGVLTSWPFL